MTENCFNESRGGIGAAPFYLKNMTGREHLHSINKLQGSYTLSEVVEIIEGVTSKKLSITPYKNFKHMIDEEFGTIGEFAKALHTTRPAAYRLMKTPNSIKVRHLLLLKKKGVEPMNLITLNDMEGEE
jgi:hypothetical protein